MFSGGKDSFAALLELRRDPRCAPERLIVTVGETSARVALHGTPLELVRAQAESLGLPLSAIELPEGCDDQTYIDRVGAALAPLADAGLTEVAFGDLFLDDIRAFRERQMRALGIACRFPIWHRETSRLAMEMIDLGVEAVVCCVDLEVLPASMLGRTWDRAMLADLPDGCDPCGENGEFHTLVLNGPGMARPMAVSAHGHRVSLQRFCMLDLRPA